MPGFLMEWEKEAIAGVLWRTFQKQSDVGKMLKYMYTTTPMMWRSAELEPLGSCPVLSAFVNLCAVSCPSGSDNELCGAAGWPGVCDCEGALQGTEPCHAVRMHRYHRCPPAQWQSAVLSFPRPLREDGCSAFPGESGEAWAPLSTENSSVRVLPPALSSHTQHNLTLTNDPRVPVTSVMSVTPR